MAGVAIVIGFILSRSLFGFRLKAIGGNPAAAELARLPIVKYKFAAFIICSVLATPRGDARLRVHRLGPAERRRRADRSRSSRRSSSVAPAWPAAAARPSARLSGALLLAIIANGLALLSAGSYLSNFVLGRRDDRGGRARPVHAEPPQVSEAAAVANAGRGGAAAGRGAASADPRTAQVVRRHPGARRPRPRGHGRARSSAWPARTAPARARSSRSSPARRRRTPARSSSTAVRGTRRRIAIASRWSTRSPSCSRT